MAGCSDAINKATKMIGNANTALISQTTEDAEQQKIKKLRDQYVDQKQCVDNCPENVRIAEKNWYYARPNGKTLYNNILQQRATKEAKDSVANWKEKMIPKLEAIETTISYYKSQYSYKDNVKSVYNSYNDKLTSIQDDIDETQGQKNVNNRLATFYNYNTGIVNTLLYYLKINYWIVFGIIVVLIIWKRQYKDVTMFAFPLLILFFPLFLEKGIHFKIPGFKQYFSIPSIYDRVVQSFKHAKIDNMYLVFFSIIIGVIVLFNYVSTLPFNYE